jgi:hypothetical protein
VITLSSTDHPEFLHIPYRGAPPTDPEVALVPASPGRIPEQAVPDWRPAEFVAGDAAAPEAGAAAGTIRVLLGAEPHVYPNGRYAIAVRYRLGVERPRRWAGWIALE